MYLTVFVGNEPPFSIKLEDYGKEKISFGNSPENDIVLQSRIVSRQHGFFRKEGSSWQVEDNHSTNGLYVNETAVTRRLLSDGLKLYVGAEGHSERVVFLVSVQDRDSMYQHFSLKGMQDVRIGRQKDCEILLEHIGVSGIHAKITREGDGYYIRPAEKCELRYNGRSLGYKGTSLKDMDRFLIADTLFLYRAEELVYSSYKDGLGLEVSHLSKHVKSGKGQKTIVDDVNLQILPGEFTAIIGGSGAGKSSLLKCISGCTGFDAGQVLIQGEDIRSGYEGLKRLIGYVPQQDIVYDNLTLERMLQYSAFLRMPEDAGAEDIRSRIQAVIQMVELEGHEKTLIRNLSGGQKKRASIAVELLSDPGIFFLDEPTSGLDPGTEKSLMCTLKTMAEQGKTIILVTHTPLNLDLCDRIIVMGSGGRLCYSGSPDNAKAFFHVSSLVDIYHLVQQDAAMWRDRYGKVQSVFPQAVRTEVKDERKGKVPLLRQLGILSARYLEMIKNDRKKLAVQMLMPLVLGVLLYLAFSGGLHPFEVAPDTQTFSLALACCCFWMGLFQSIQEICKERMIVEREKMADLRSGAYLVSKILILGVILLLQSILMLGFVWAFIGHPAQGMYLKSAPFLEYLLTTYLTALSAAMLGLLVSAAVGSTDQAVSVAPLLLIPQILFSEIICTLSGAAEKLSWMVGCKWCCLAYGALSDINSLAPEYGKSWLDSSEAEVWYNARYDIGGPGFSMGNPVFLSWVALAALTFLFALAAYMAVRKRREI